MDSLVFIVDLNELSGGDVLPVSMDYTVNLGPRRRLLSWQMPERGSLVKLHSDDDDTLYHGEVVRQLSDRDFEVRIHWDTCTPVLNREWSARSEATHYLPSRSVSAVEG